MLDSPAVDKLRETASRVAITLLAGIGLGALVAALIAPGIIEWFNSPAVPSAFQCTEQVSWALSRFRTSLWVSAAIAGVVAVVLVEVVRSVRGKKKEA